MNPSPLLQTVHNTRIASIQSSALFLSSQRRIIEPRQNGEWFRVKFECTRRRMTIIRRFNHDISRVPMFHENLHRPALLLYPHPFLRLYILPHDLFAAPLSRYCTRHLYYLESYSTRKDLLLRPGSFHSIGRRIVFNHLFNLSWGKFVKMKRRRFCNAEYDE